MKIGKTGLRSLVKRLTDPTSVISPLSDDVPPINIGKTGLQSLSGTLPKVRSVFNVPMMAYPKATATRIAPTPTPGYLFPKHTPTPTPTQRRIDPMEPMNIPKDFYAGRTVDIQPEWYDAIDAEIQDPYKKRLAFSLLTQESSGGKSLVGDNGTSFGGYHISSIYRPHITREQAMNPTLATRIVSKEMDANEKKGWSKKNLIKTWNYKSVQPDYGDDLPRMATTSSFIRGK